MSRIFASNIVGGPPKGAVAFVNQNDCGFVAWSTDTNVVVWGEKRCWEEALVDVQIALDEKNDPLGMVKYGLKVALARRLGIAVCGLPSWSAPENTPHFRGLLNGHRYVAKTDRLCKRLNMALEPKEVATWHRNENGAWELGTKKGSNYRVLLDVEADQWSRALDLAAQGLRTGGQS